MPTKEELAAKDAAAKEQAAKEQAAALMDELLADDGELDPGKGGNGVTAPNPEDVAIMVQLLATMAPGKGRGIPAQPLAKDDAGKFVLRVYDGNVSTKMDRTRRACEVAMGLPERGLVARSNKLPGWKDKADKRRTIWLGRAAVVAEPTPTEQPEPSEAK